MAITRTFRGTVPFPASAAAAKRAASHIVMAGAAVHRQNKRLESHPRPLYIVLREYAALISNFSIIMHTANFIGISNTISQSIFWKVLPIRKSDMKTMAPTDMASRIKLPNVSSTIALFLLMIHLPDVTKNV